jgi:hypothetical protein
VVNGQRNRAPVVAATGAQGEVLDEVGGAGDRGFIVGCAAGDPDAGRHRFPTRHRLRQKRWKRGWVVVRHGAKVYYICRSLALDESQVKSYE